MQRLSVRFLMRLHIHIFLTSLWSPRTCNAGKGSFGTVVLYRWKKGAYQLVCSLF